MQRTLPEINASIAEMEKERREILKKIEEAEREKDILVGEMQKEFDAMKKAAYNKTEK